MPGRNYQSSNSYRYGFNGKENDNEVVGTGSGTQDYGLRIYNPALGKFLSVDPLAKDYPWYTPYQFAGNKPIQFIDIDGAEEGAPMQPGGVFQSAIDNSRAGYSNNYLINRYIIAPIEARKEEMKKEADRAFKSYGEFKPVNFIDKYFEGKSDFERTLVMDPTMQIAASAVFASGSGRLFTSAFNLSPNKYSLIAGKTGGALADATTQYIANGNSFNNYNFTSTLTELNPFGYVTGALFQGIASEAFKLKKLDEKIQYQGLGSSFFDVEQANRAAINSIFNISGNLLGDYPGLKFEKFNLGPGFDFNTSFIFNAAGNVISNTAQDAILPEKPAPIKLPKSAL